METSEKKSSAAMVAVVMAVVLVVVLVIGGIMFWNTSERMRADVRKSQQQNSELNDRMAKVLEQIEKQRTLPSGEKRLPAPEELATQEAQLETQKQDLANKVADRVNPILMKLGQGQVLTSEQIEAAKAQIVSEIQDVVKAEQKRNEELQKMMAVEQVRGQGLEKMVDAEQTKGLALQNLLQAEQRFNEELQGKSMSTYQVAADTLRLANELRILYLQERKRDSSLLTNALETVTLPVKMIGNVVNKNISSSDELKKREAELTRNFDELTRRLETFAPKSSLPQSAPQASPSAAAPAVAPAAAPAPAPVKTETKTP